MNRTPNRENDRAAAGHAAAAARRGRRAAGGFTLIEIIVSLSAGLLVSMAAFSMSKNATAFFQHEARISSTQLALTLGMNRLTADIQRAAFLASPNAAADPMVCRDGSWTTGLKAFSGITIQHGPAVALSQAANNGLLPDQVIIGGSLDTSEIFTIQCVTAGTGGGPALQLQTAVYDNAMARVQASLGPTELLVNKLALIFAPGRFVNIFDPATGYHVYGVVGPAPTVASGVATVQLASGVALPKKPASTCGILDPSQGPQCGAGLMVSAVSRYLYDVRSLAGLATGNYGKLVAPLTPATTGDAGRTELIRVELDSAGAEIPGTLSLISEYAVDLRFGITVGTKIVNDDYNPTVLSYGINDSHVYDIAGDVTGSTPTSGATPQRIRAVEMRLSTRTRAPDRNTDLVAGIDGRRLHYLIFPGTHAQPTYARVRTNYANVALPNQGGFSLW